MPTLKPLEQLQALAKEMFIRDPQKLMFAARRKGLVVNPHLAERALAQSVPKQIFAAHVLSKGKSAAEGPGSRLQADLIDFSKNTSASSGAKYAEVLVDVFSRRVWAQAIPRKDAATVKAATEHLLTEMPENFHKEKALLSTDAGKEYAQLDQIPGLIHIEKRPFDTNAIGVVDKRIQILKNSLGGAATEDRRKYFNWDEKLPAAVHAANENYTSAVHGAPNDVGGDNIQTFMTLQDNASHFMHNKELSEKRQRDIELAGAYRAPLGAGGRSFKPRFGKLQEFASFTPGGQYVVDDKGKKNLLKMARPAELGSGEAEGALTIPHKKVKVRGPQTTGNKPMTKKIPVAAGTPLEAPRFRVRLQPHPKAKTVKPAAEKASKGKSPLEEPRASEGLSSGSAGPNLLNPKGTQCLPSLRSKRRRMCPREPWRKSKQKLRRKRQKRWPQRPPRRSERQRRRRPPRRS